jgi:hypothetical protein
MTYGNVMRQMQGKEPLFSGATAKEVKTEKAIYQGFVRNAQRLVYNALKSGNINALAQILADGLKQNNKLLQQEKGITRGFCAYADIGGQVMDLMEKYPAIKTAVQKQNLLTPDDLSIAKAGKAISDVHTKGLTAQRELLKRFVQSDRGEEFIKDVQPKFAAVCQMYGVNKQIGGKKLNLATCPYGKIPNFDQQLNKTLAGNEPMVGFLKEFAKKEHAEMVNIIRNPEQMANLYQQGILNTMERNLQQNAPALKPNVAQNEHQQEQVKGGVGMN